MKKVVVVYDHDPADLSTIELGFGDEPKEWFPAFRDTIDDRKVVWIKREVGKQQVWLRDREGIKKVRAIRL